MKRLPFNMGWPFPEQLWEGPLLLVVYLLGYFILFSFIRKNILEEFSNYLFFGIFRLSLYMFVYPIVSFIVTIVGCTLRLLLKLWDLTGLGLKTALRLHVFSFKFVKFVRSSCFLLFFKEEYMVVAIDTERDHDYICKDDLELPERERTVFSLKYLTAQEDAKIRDSMYEVQGFGPKRTERFLTGKQEIATLKKGLKGFSNFKNEDGDEIKFVMKGNECDDKMLNYIPARFRVELANHIRGTEDEEEEGEIVQEVSVEDNSGTDSEVTHKD